jgi:hypothetical protein
VNLTVLDAPGFHISKREPEHESAADKRFEHEMLRCVQAASTKSLLEANSKEFERESSAAVESVQSQVTVARTFTVAAKELAVIRSAHARACFSHYSDLLLKGKQYRGATFGPVSIAQGTPPAPGSTGSFAWRISVPIMLHGVRLPLYIDILGFIYGPSEISLFTEGFPAPVPAATEERLFSLLLKRAEAHKI